MTTKTSNPERRNAIIMGRLTYFGIPESKRPLPNRLNIVLSSTLNSEDVPSDVVLCPTLTDAVTKLSNSPLGSDIENIWIGGGNSVYREAMASDDCHRIYFTEIKMHCDCDAFFPEIPSDFQQVPNDDDDVPSGIQEENGTKYEYKIFEKKSKQ